MAKHVGLKILDSLEIKHPCNELVQSQARNVAGSCIHCNKPVYDSRQLTRLETFLLLIASRGNCCMRIQRSNAGRVEFAHWSLTMNLKRCILDTLIACGALLAGLPMLTKVAIAESNTKLCNDNAVQADNHMELQTKPPTQDRFPLGYPKQHDKFSKIGHTHTIEYGEVRSPQPLAPWLSYTQGTLGFLIMIGSAGAGVLLMTLTMIRRNRWVSVIGLL